MSRRNIRNKSVSEEINNGKYEERKEVLTSFFSDELYKNNMTLKQIASILEVPKDELDILKNILQELEQEGIIFADENLRYVKTFERGYQKGVFEAKSKKFGFVFTPDNKEYYIPEGHVNGALDKDEVLIKIIRKKQKESKRTEADIVKVIKRNKTKVIGKYTKNTNFGFVEPLDLKIDDIFIPKRFMKNYKEGDIVEVEIVKYATNDSKPEGKIIGLIGNEVKDHDVYVKALYKSFGLNNLDTFGTNVLQELSSISDEVQSYEEIGREDRTDLKVVTIDSEDAKDLDDACFVKKLNNGMYLLSVFIADVSHYVKEGTNLDKEAIDRGTSIYIPGTVIPMLPKKLSNGICSLNAGVKRLALGVDITIDKDGKVVNSEIYKAVIKVAKKMTYEKVYKVLQKSDDLVLEEYKEFIEQIETMHELSKLLYAQRKLSGSIDFDIPETKVYLDEYNNVEKIEPYKITDANKIIEEFMLITNMVIAEKFFFLDMPFIYRIHEKPDEEKLRGLNEVLTNYSKSIKSVKNIHPKTLASIIDSITDEDEKEVVSAVMLRTLKVAKYSNECLGHFGLAARYYTHFTSPIRRYPDLFIHRVISDYIDSKGDISNLKLQKYDKQAYKYSFSSSEMEKQATKIEREFISLYEALYMQDFMFQDFDAVVSSVTSFGMFVKLANTVEGFVSFDNMSDDDYYIFDETKKMLIGRKTANTFRVSDKVRVKLIRVDIPSKQIDFKIL